MKRKGILLWVIILICTMLVTLLLPVVTTSAAEKNTVSVAEKNVVTEEKVLAGAKTKKEEKEKEQAEKVPEFVIKKGVLKKYNGKREKVVIPESVTAIGEKAFYGCKTVKQITISKNVKTIDTYTFTECPRLKRFVVSKDNKYFMSDKTGVLFNKKKTKLVSYPHAKARKYTIPKGIKTIGERAFGGNNNLIKITMSDSIEKIEDDAFSFCENLQKVTLSRNVKIIGDSAFYHCLKLKEIKVPDSVTKIKSSAFGWCTSLEKIRLSENITCINNNLFHYCISLREVKIPAKVRQIKSGAFSECTSLVSLTIPKHVSSISNEAFDSCTGLEKFVVQKGNARFSTEQDGVLFNKKKTALIACPGGLKGTYTVPQSVKTINKNAFYGCDKLTGVILPENLWDIMDYAFYNCVALKEITIPKEVRQIGSMVFQGCTNLEKIIVNTENRYFSSDEGGVLFDKYKTILLVCPQGYKGVCNIPESVTSVDNEAFGASKNMTKIEVHPDNSYYKSDDDGVLYDKNMKSLICCPAGMTGVYKVAEGTTYIYGEAFHGCDKLIEIYIPNSVWGFYTFAFQGCENVTIVVPKDSSLVKILKKAQMKWRYL